MDALAVWRLMQLAVSVATLGLVALFFYDLLIASAGRAKLVAEGLAAGLLTLATLALGIQPPAPPAVPSHFTPSHR